MWLQRCGVQVEFGLFALRRDRKGSQASRFRDAAGLSPLLESAIEEVEHERADAVAGLVEREMTRVE